MRVKKASFNHLVFICLGLQYLLMHFFSAGEAIVITTIELIIFMIYTVCSLIGLFVRGKRVAGETLSGMAAFFFSVLWTVSFFSHFQKESYPEALTLINSLGVSTALLVLLTEFIVIAKA